MDIRVPQIEMKVHPRELELLKGVHSEWPNFSFRMGDFLNG